MVKRILVWLLVAAIIFLVSFAFFYKGTKGNLSDSLTYAAITAGGLVFALIVGPADLVRAKYNAQKYNTDVGTGAVIGKLEEQNRQLEEQNRRLEEQNRNKR